MTSQRSTAHLMLWTGALYLLIICLGLYAEVAVRSSLIVAGDPAATADNILASPWLFKSAFAGDLAIFLCDVAVAALLYALLRPVSKTGSLLAAGFRLTGTAIYGANLLNFFAAFLVLGGSGYLAVFGQDKLHAMALLFLDIHKHGYDLGLVFFGAHCLALGHLMWRSDLFPKLLAILMALAGFAYLVGSGARFFLPQYVEAVAPIYVLALVGELGLSAWLLAKGWRLLRSDRM